MNCADVTAGTVDQVVKQILKDSYEQAKELLSHHRKALDEIAAFLIERESITGREFMEIFHKIENPKMEGEDHEGAQGSEAAAGCESIDDSKMEDSPETEGLLPGETADTVDFPEKTDETETAGETTIWETTVREEDTTL